MAGLFEKFEDGVINQLKLREQAYDIGRNTSRSTNIIDNNNKNSWIRLASSIDIHLPTTAETPAGREKEFEKRIEGIKKKFGVGEGSDLARALVLTGGTSKYNSTAESIEGRSGFDPSNGATNKGAYGLGGTNFGYKPMPGIVSADIGFKDSDGALKKATIKIKCFSPDQLDMLESLYCRVGYNILLEWGHVNWLTNINQETKIAKIQNYFTGTSEAAVVTPAFKEFFKKRPSPKVILNKVKEDTTKKSYNYEGFYGIISKFSYTFNEDASYDITVEAYTMGSIVQGLTIGSHTNNGPQDVTDEEADKDERPANKLEQLLAILEKAPMSNANPNGWSKNSAIADQRKYIELFKLKQNIAEMNSPFYKVFSDKKSGIDIIKILWGSATTEEGKKERVYESYMNFRALLVLLDKHANIYRKKDTPILNFEGDNPMFSVPYHFSGDPQMCILPFEKILVPPTDGTIPGTSKLQRNFSFSNYNAKYNVPEGSDPEFTSLVENGFIKDLNKVFISFSLIRKSIDANKDNTGRVPAVLFLQSILDEVKDCLGGINNFRVIVDDETLQVNIVDYGTLIGTRQKGLYKFTTYGVGTGNNIGRASMLHNLNFTTTIPNDLAANVTVGAQVNGNQIGENAVSFSEFNTGLIDRTVYEKATLPSGDPNNAEAAWVTLLKNIKETILDVYTLSGRTIGELGLEEFKGEVPKANQRLKSLNSDYIKWVVGYYARTQSVIANPFIIPFDLTFTIDGIAGIKVFQTFEIDDRILPYMYKGKVRFVAFDISHKLDNNKWTTTIKGKTVPKLDNPKKFVAPADLGTLDGVDPKTSRKLQDAYIQRDSQAAPSTGKTLILQTPISSIYYKKAVTKTQVYLHHTAGAQGPVGVARDWSGRVDRGGAKIATHYVIGRDGVYDLIFPLETGWAYHLGTNQKADPTGIGIELTSYGAITKGYYYKYNATTKKNTYVKGKADTFYNAYGGVMSADEVVRPVAEDGTTPIKNYHGIQYFQEYTDKQLAKLEEVLIQITKTYKQIPMVYSYDLWFPSKKGKNGRPITFEDVNNQRTPGLYTHGTVRWDKNDVAPTPKMIAFGKKLAEKQDPQAALVILFKRGLEDMINNFNVSDSDDESTKSRARAAYTKIEQDGVKYIKTLSKGDVKKFRQMTTEVFKGDYEALCMYIFGVNGQVVFERYGLSKPAKVQEYQTFVTQILNSTWENGAEVKIKRRLKKVGLEVVVDF